MLAPRRLLRRGHNMILMIIGFIIVSLLSGFIARALVPGRDKMSIKGTILLGAVGSFIGGFLGYLVKKDASDGAFQTAGIIGSIIGSIIALLLYRRFGKSLTKAK
jgi:uncharacterized membrane protein YeaQ/YmgE (transglycosylase-associated protein family)